MINLNFGAFLLGLGLICIELLLTVLFFWAYVRLKDTSKLNNGHFIKPLAKGFLFLGLAIVTAILLWVFSAATENPSSRLIGLLSIGSYVVLNLAAAFQIIKGVRISGPKENA